jgi:DNA repair exonuclease SbcCD ATPase subunit
MASRSDVQRQLSQLVSMINAQGFEYKDVMPDEMRVHFQETVALKEAHAYIKEIEGREKKLQASNASLQTQLEVKQAEIDDQPEEFKALKVDLQQSQHRIDYYKKLANHHETGAERCQCKLTEAYRAQRIANYDAKKIERLERDLAERDADVQKLLQKTCTMTAIYETEREADLRLTKEKDVIIDGLTTRIKQIETEKIKVDENSEQIAETCNSLIEDLEQESLTVAEVVNFKSIKLFEMRESHDQLSSAVASKLAPLNHLYDHICGIMKIYRSIFQCLSNPHTYVVPRIPQSLDDMLDAANDQLYVYQQISDNFHNQPVQKYGLAQQKVFQQVDGIAKAAARTCTSMEDIKGDISDLLDQLRNKPGTWLATNSQFDSVTSTPFRISASPQRSISTLISFTKHFSTSSSSTASS